MSECRRRTGGRRAAWCRKPCAGMCCACCASGAPGSSSLTTTSTASRSAQKSALKSLVLELCILGPWLSGQHVKQRNLALLGPLLRQIPHWPPGQSIVLPPAAPTGCGRTSSSACRGTKPAVSSQHSTQSLQEGRAMDTPGAVSSVCERHDCS